MKLVFNHADNGMTLAFVECASTEEADKFLTWFDARARGEEPVVMEEPTVARETTVEVAPALAPVVPTGGVPKPSKITRKELSEAAMELIATKGRSSVQAVLEHFGVKRVSEIPDERMAEAYNRIKEVV